jgi:LPS-assembly protein
MSLLLPVVLLLVTAQPPLSTQLSLPTGETAELAADHVLYEPSRQVLTARGHAVLRSGQMLLRADELVYDHVGEHIVARGNVMLVGGMMAAVADELTLDLNSQEALAKGGLFMHKRGVTPEALLAAQTPQELRDLGETPTLLSGTRLQRTGENSFVVDGAAFTPCQCDPSAPSWRVEASRAEVNMGESAVLTWPVVYFKSIPVLALPLMYLPLADRRSGLLVPVPSMNVNTGFSFEQPLFLTLGRSYDLTVTPAYYFGTEEVDRNPSDDIEQLEPRPIGVRGPRLHTEFRYTPSAKTQGRATLGLLYDFQPLRNPVSSDFFRDASGTLLRQPRGPRGEASLQHRQDMGGGFHNRIDAYVVSDGFYMRDVTVDILARESQFLRSTGVLFHQGSDHWLGLEVGLRQDIRWGYPLLGGVRIPQGATVDSVVPAPRVFQKLPALTWFLPERPLPGGFSGGLKVEFTRLSPLRSRFGDEGMDGVFNLHRLYTGPDGNRLVDEAQGNGLFDARDREARSRLDILPRLSASYALGPYARLTPTLSLRQDLFLGEMSGRTAWRGYPMLDLVVDSELARTFALPGTTLRHTLAPSARLRYVPLVWGGLPPPGASPALEGMAYDEIDAALPATAPGAARRFLHAVVELHQTLRASRGNTRSELLRLTLGQGFDLSRHAPTLGQGEAMDDPRPLRDTYARLSTTLGILGAGAELRFDPNAREISQLSANLRIASRRGEVFFLEYSDLLGVGSDRLRRSLDALVGPVQLSPLRAQVLRAGTQVSLGKGLGIGYEAMVQPLARNDSPLWQQRLVASYGPACNCWRVEGFARLERGRVLPDFGLNLTVSGVGTFGTGR